MGFVDKIRSVLQGPGLRGAGPLEEARELDVPSGTNFRELGGYDTPWGPTRYRRFVRAGSSSQLSDADLTRLEDYGIRRVLDLRSELEAPQATDRFSRRENVEWLNVALFDYDLSDPRLAAALPEGNYLIDGYVTMLSNRTAIRRIFTFFGDTPAGEGVLFHCAAGMDRTGMTAMLLLDLVGVSRDQIVADYLYSFAPPDEVDDVIFGGATPRALPGEWNPYDTRREAIEFMYDRVAQGYGSARAYLRACGVDEACLDRVRDMLVGSGATEGDDQS